MGLLNGHNFITHTHTPTHPHAAMGQTLRCDVFVASIEHIEITTRTRELLLGEEPERFSVQAFYEEGTYVSKGLMWKQLQLSSGCVDSHPSLGLLGNL